MLEGRLEAMRASLAAQAQELDTLHQQGCRRALSLAAAHGERLPVCQPTSPLKSAGSGRKPFAKA